MFDRQEYSRQWREQNREAILANQAAYREKNRERLREKARARYQRDSEASPEKFRDESRKWREANPERKRAVALAWYYRNKDQQADARRAWKQANREKVAQQESRRRAHKLGVESEKVDYEAIIKRDRSICHLCGKRVPRKDIHIDHLVPLSLGGPHTAANVAVAHSLCNLRKNTKAANEQLRLVG